VRRALSFLTPLGGATEPRPSAVAWFPAVGLLVGLAVGLVWAVAGQLWPPAVAAALALTCDLVLTGFLHVDGLADSADGLLPPLGRAERRLDVMADPHVGAFGAAAVVVVLLTRWTVLASQQVSVPLVAGLWCASRTAMAATVMGLPYARPGGLAAAFRRTEGRGGLAVLGGGGVVLAAASAWLGRGTVGLVAVAVALLAAALVVGAAVRRLGGFTGDVLGAAGMVGETAGLLLAAARW
jgi:adenosylcobinamide-GDP ribazoletransferase